MWKFGSFVYEEWVVTDEMQSSRQMVPIKPKYVNSSLTVLLHVTWILVRKELTYITEFFDTLVFSLFKSQTSWFWAARAGVAGKTHPCNLERKGGMSATYNFKLKEF